MGQEGEIFGFSYLRSRVFERCGVLLMAIHIKCPKGHSLTAQESDAGKTGKCPVCKCAVAIPAVKRDVLTESAVLDILGNPDPKASLYAQTEALFTTELAAETHKKTPGLAGTDSLAALPTPLSGTKTCGNCERDIDTGYHICPHCKTYLVDKL